MCFLFMLFWRVHVNGWTMPSTTFVFSASQRQHSLCVSSQKDSSTVASNNNSTQESTAVETLNDWESVASGSFGNLLLQMQRRGDFQGDVVDLDRPAMKANDTTKKGTLPESDYVEEIPVLDWETAKELDGSVKWLDGAEQMQTPIQVLPMSSLYRSHYKTVKGIPLSIADTPSEAEDPFGGRLSRDMRFLALNILASTETVEQWKLLARETDGLFPLLEIIRHGAMAIQKVSPEQADSSTAYTLESTEQAYRAACSACRVIRDLSALSPDLAAVITDTILRANAAWKGGLMRDFSDILQHANEYTDNKFRRNQREIRLRSKLYVCQLLLAMVVSSDNAIDAIRSTNGLADAVLGCSSYARKEKARRWVRYPGEMAKWLWQRKARGRRTLRRPFLEAATLGKDLNANVKRIANQILAAIGYNQWTPKTPGQRGLRILSLDGGGSRGMVAVTAVRDLMEKIGNGAEVADCFDIVAGTSTGGIIAFLTAIRQETCAEAVERYNQLIKQIFVKSALSTPLMFFTTASYDEAHFMKVLTDILRDEIMLDSRADPTVPLVFCVTSKMSSTPTHVSLMRNYNYANGELADSFVINPDKAREELGLGLELEHPIIRNAVYARKRVSPKAPGADTTTGSRYPGSFRVLQRFALRASTAAPTVFKPVMMGGEIYADGGIVSSNPSAVAIHEARTLFPDIPIELLVSVGTGAFVEQKSAPRIGWDGIIGQIVNSACDGEQTHHILEDILGNPAAVSLGSKTSSMTRYFRLNPVLGLPDEFPIDVTDPIKLEKLKRITLDYMNQEEKQVEEIRRILGGERKRRRGFLRRLLRKRQ